MLIQFPALLCRQVLRLSFHRQTAGSLRSLRRLLCKSLLPVVRQKVYIPSLTQVEEKLPQQRSELSLLPVPQEEEVVALEVAGARLAEGVVEEAEVPLVRLDLHNPFPQLPLQALQQLRSLY